MPQPYSQELRKRMITAVEAGNSRREVARSFNVSPGCVIKLMQQWEATGDCCPYQQKALAEHEAEVRALLVADPDISVTELWCAIKALGIKVSRATVGRFLQYLKLKTKKGRVRRRTTTANRPSLRRSRATSRQGKQQ
jgi:transposase